MASHQLNPVCFRHNQSWQLHVHEVMNSLRSLKLISAGHLFKFNNLLCTCGLAKNKMSYDNQWNDVPDEKIASAVTFIDEYISRNFQQVETTIFKKVMHWLRNTANVSLDPSQLHQRCSAARLVYLLMMIIEKDYCIFDVKHTAEGREKKVYTEEMHTFEVKNCDPSSVGKMVGTLGCNIEIFRNKYKCWVKFHEEHGKVMATIKKNVTDKKKLEQIATHLLTYCQEYQRDVEQQMDVDVVQSVHGSAVPGIVGTSANVEDNLAAELPGNSSIGQNPGSLPNPAAGDPGSISLSHFGESRAPPVAPDIRLDHLSLNQPDQNQVPDRVRTASNGQLAEPSCKKHKTNE